MRALYAAARASEAVLRRPRKNEQRVGLESIFHIMWTKLIPASAFHLTAGLTWMWTNLEPASALFLTQMGVRRQHQVKKGTRENSATHTKRTKKEFGEAESR